MIMLPVMAMVLLGGFGVYQRNGMPMGAGVRGTALVIFVVLYCLGVLR